MIFFYLFVLRSLITTSKRTALIKLDDYIFSLVKKSGFFFRE